MPADLGLCCRRQANPRIVLAANMTRRTSSLRGLFFVWGLLAAAGALLGLPSLALAMTAISGGNVGGQTWTAAGSPYVISGDITVQNNSTLTIQKGVDVQFKGSDGTHGGLDASRTELTVNGKLVVNGFSGSPVTFETQIGSSGNWYGIVVNSQAFGVNISGLVLQNAYQGAITNWMTGAPLTITDQLRRRREGRYWLLVAVPALMQGLGGTRS
jgi:hypothetical protein